MNFVYFHDRLAEEFSRLGLEGATPPVAFYGRQGHTVGMIEFTGEGPVWMGAEANELPDDWGAQLYMLGEPNYMTGVTWLTEAERRLGSGEAVMTDFIERLKMLLPPSITGRLTAHV